MVCKALLKAKGGRALEVQYNPAALSLTASGRTIAYDNTQTSEKSDDIAQSADNGSITLSMELVVDSGGAYPVSTMVEGFLGLLAKESTKVLTFVWGEMSFCGILQSLSASYEMFAPDGTPLRGRLQLTLKQAGADVKAVQYWNRSYEKMF